MTLSKNNGITKADRETLKQAHFGPWTNEEPEVASPKKMTNEEFRAWAFGGKGA